MNRQQRRAALRVLPSPAVTPPPLCRPGTHQLGRVDGTVKGAVVATVVMCSACRRSFQQILAEDPDYAAMYNAWRAAGEPEDWTPAKAEA